MFTAKSLQKTTEQADDDEWNIKQMHLKFSLYYYWNTWTWLKL